ncbi:NTP transferase domain-containing protein [Aquimarina addita]|uniref:NTP transferase domain-containing protein n=1 Tax=Aquimarina addita TaxID=870485 RepID=A0ABP6UK62_9FLAO
MAEPKIAHFILAAGASSRMGTPKQLLPWFKDTLITYEISKSIQLKNVKTYVILGANYEIIDKEIKDFAVTIIYNNNWQLGMGTSIRCGVQYILKEDKKFDAILITLVDQPMIDLIHLNELLLKWSTRSQSIIATKMEKGKGVPAIFPSSYFKDLLKLKNDYGARYLIKQYEDQVVSIAANAKTDDIDTIDQYKSLLEKVNMTTKQSK